MRISLTFTCIITLIESVRAVLPFGTKMGCDGRDGRARGLRNDGNKIRSLPTASKGKGFAKKKALKKGGPHEIRGLKKTGKVSKASKLPKKQTLELVEPTDLSMLTLDWWDWALCMDPYPWEDPECPSQYGVPYGWNFFSSGRPGDLSEITLHECTLQEGKTTLLPVINFLNWAEDVDCVGLGLTDQQCADAVRASCDWNTVTAEATLDGIPIEVQSISTPIVRKFKSSQCKNSLLEGAEFVYGCGQWVNLPPATAGDTHEVFIKGCLLCGCEDYCSNVTHIVTVV